MSMCCYCKSEAIKDVCICGEIFCRYECYNNKYDLETEEEEE